MINSTAFDYVNVLTKAADASYQREAILANNISNVDTPGYKRKDLNFEGVLSQELGRCKHQSLDKKISELDTSKLTANVYTDEPKSGTMQQDTKLDMKQMTGIDISGIIKTQPASAAPASKAGATATTGTAAAVSVKASDAAFGTPAGSSANADVINHTHEILKLYKSGKSNVEIAKLLSLGTGEVKLIIDLYKEGK